MFPFTDAPDAPTSVATGAEHALASRGRDWYARCYLLRAGEALAGSVVTYTLPLAVLAATHAPAWAAVALGAEWTLRLLAGTLAAPMVDRHGPYRATQTVGAVRLVTVLAAMTALAPGGHLAVLLGFGTLAAAASPVGVLAARRLDAEAVRRADHQGRHVQRRLDLIDQLAAVAGPAMACALLLAGPALLLATAAILSAVSLATAGVQPMWLPGPAAVRRGAVPGPATGVRITGGAVARPGVALTAVTAATSVLAAAALVTVTGHGHRQAVAVDLVWTVAVAAGQSAAVVARRLLALLGPYRLALAAAVLTCAAGTAAALTTTVSSCTAALAAFTAAEGVCAVALSATCADLRFAGRPALQAGAVLLAAVSAAGLVVAAVPTRAVPALLTPATQVLIWAVVGTLLVLHAPRARAVGRSSRAAPQTT
ncbi:hypothetical protein [Kitasatospora sp. GAS1066B]|uniref:hypothetical protein n=1 Tax=Kitasatospora sp. GAS1066B TaxID=3156271 RepID=UPI00351364A9